MSNSLFPRPYVVTFKAAWRRFLHAPRICTCWTGVCLLQRETYVVYDHNSGVFDQNQLRSRSSSLRKPSRQRLDLAFLNGDEIVAAWKLLHGSSPPGHL